MVEKLQEPKNVTKGGSGPSGTTEYEYGGLFLHLVRDKEWNIE